MAEATEFETDAFLKLLTDALRAGPGSPQWHEAVMQLRSQNPSADTDDYRLLITAREHLESGREFRSVRAGPGFTRKVMDTIEQEATKPRTPVSTASAVAWLGAALILGVVVAIAVILSRGETPTRTVQDLRNTPFTTTVLSSDFTASIPPEWKPFGVAPLIPDMENALHPGARSADSPEGKFVGGGLVSATPFAADQPIQIDLSAAMDRPSDDVVLQLFVTEQPTFDSGAEATTSSEFAVNLKKDELAAVKPDGSLAGRSGKVDTKRPIHLIARFDARFVIVEDGSGKELYAGEHGLSADKPRYPGLRFLLRGNRTDPVTVQSLRVTKP